MAHETRHPGSASHDVSFSDEISTTTLVKLLVRKGILTTKEVLEEERNTRLQQQVVEAKLEHHLEHKQKKRSRIKKWASKHKWSRRVTARLLGWEWKRSKSDSGSAG
jgi:hypothetical protein